MSYRKIPKIVKWDEVTCDLNQYRVVVLRMLFMVSEFWKICVDCFGRAK